MTPVLKTFCKFHRANPHVYELFCRYAHEARKRGYRQFGAAAIYERMRWHVMIETNSDSEFKLSNNHKAYYARMFMIEFPEAREFFRRRELTAADEAEAARVLGELVHGDFG